MLVKFEVFVDDIKLVYMTNRRRLETGDEKDKMTALVLIGAPLILQLLLCHL